MTSEGSREIEAARLRLAAAKSQVSTASKNMNLVIKMMDNAKDMSNAADKEYAEAQIMLAAAEKRWEVINVDEEDPEPMNNNEGSNKRRKVSLSPQSNNNNNSTTNNTQSSADNSSNGIDRIVVEDCGITGLNGVYKKALAQMNDGAPVYVKPGYRIFRKSTGASRYWCIGRWNGITNSFGVIYYQSPNNLTENDWANHSTGVIPAPKCRLIALNNSTTNNPTSSNQAFTNNSRAASSTTSNTIRSTAHNNARAPTTTPNNGNEVVVKCGLRELNGTYTRVVGDRLVSGSTVEYKRQGQWKGNTVDYVICLILSTRSWEMGFVKRDGKQNMGSFYRCSTGANGIIRPPENGWKATIPEYNAQRFHPLPTCLPPSRLFARSSLPPPPQTGTSNSSLTGFKRCGNCGTLKKKHSYLRVEWDKGDDRERVCKVCIKNHGL